MGARPLISLIKGQRFQRLVRVSGREDDDPRNENLEANGRPTQKETDVVAKDPRVTGMGDWTEIVRDRDKWSAIVATAKTLSEYICQGGERRNVTINNIG